ncbi:MAG: GIY-YIG nuclease family protein [Patescibacteria group bacterium]
MKSGVYFVYILSNQWDTVLYVGVTNNLERRIGEHQHKAYPGFTASYQVNKLIYFETYQDAKEAIAREKQIKRWRREKKLDLIRETNPRHEDLMRRIFGDFSASSK